jgi:Phosphotransferase enzyme family
VTDTRLPEAVRDAVARAIGRPAYDDEIKIRPATPHRSNQLYAVRAQGQHLIAKEYLRADRPSASRHEYGALRRMEGLHLAPGPLFFDASVGPVVVYRYMKGEMWDRRVPSAVELGALAELWLRFNCLGTDGFWLATGQAKSWAEIEARLRAPLQSYAVWADRTSQFRDAARLCLEALDRSLAAARRLIPKQTPLCFCRSDARFANVIARTDGRLGLVDWEDSGLRDPARQVADLLIPGQIRMRVRHQNLATPWFDYLLTAVDELRALLDGTAWTLERHEIAGAGYLAVIHPRH